MARTIDEIQAEIIAAKDADSNLATLNSGSVTAIWRLITRVVAKAIVTIETLYDFYKVDVETTLATLKPHTARWYQNKALSFQYGDSLVEGEDYYDNTGVDVDTIAAKKIVSNAAVQDTSGLLIVKVNKTVSGNLEPLATAEYNAVVSYLQEIKDAGVRISVLSFNADKLKLVVDVYYDPLILGPTGARLDGSSNTPVKDAINTFLLQLPFDGTFVKAHLVDAVQAVDGVFVPEVRSCLAARYDNSSFSSVDIQYAPYSGFLRIYNDVDLTLNYIANV